MISVQDGQNRILTQITRATSPELVPLGKALGRVIAEDVRAPFDVPPADNSAVDGYAVGSADIPAGATRDLRVVADLPAGSVFDGALAAGETVRIMTGAPMPRGADTVYPQEVVTKLDGGRVEIGPIAKGANVRMRGEDIHAGTIVIERGTVLRPQEVGLIASLGQVQVTAHRRPRVVLLSTGDEVVEPGQPRTPGQIYDANRFTLRGSIEQCGGEVVDLGIVPDVRDALGARLADAGATGDVVVTSGGVSVGLYDLVKEVLDEIGAIEFWQVAMQPGRPLAVGRIGSAHFFGLPGNPVASMLAFMLFVRPAIHKLAGRRRLFPEVYEARATETMRKKTGRREFKRGILQWRDGGWEVRTTGPQGSGILSSMVAGNCLIVLEEERGDVAPGEPVLVEPF
ncbi:MAG: molybdopterin molybdenumtransferase MoeA [Candidatus Rokuibacteriota bacterium]|nr:MAG: molybdopterin molybdenumtransferase MoeA [Candidatus Rokubacteria bacterium]PYM62541.1 MAG: molybdopterin molybdenumtransferase MoeA [Candidatus Rokubacteria bacterium]PYN68350.1 MAG: molybdopterin molybdenumtransferase MoeA [Candidatus Rokubacteria bacterium]